MFYFIAVYFGNFRGGKNGGSIDPVHDRGSMDPVHIYFGGPGPWTRSTEGVHGPGAHVLYFPTTGSHCTLMADSIRVAQPIRLQHLH